ncbi:TraM recognition domain-containing protein, partial [Salmonella enterica]|uniref:TraM recognition domain-containing protein n=1 Tax=Salmonella enterica TaxID=28901 RepID=UPI000AEA1E5C
VYGELCTAAVNGFIKKRLYNEATRRGDNWKADSTNTAAMIVMDEADVLLDETDAGILPRGRSLGLNFVVGLQAVEQAEAAFGGTQNAPKALAMLAQLRSVVALSSTHHTAQYVSDRVGFGLPLEPVSLSTVPDMRYTVLQRAAASPFNDEANEFRS